QRRAGLVVVEVGLNVSDTREHKGQRLIVSIRRQSSRIRAGVDICRSQGWGAVRTRGAKAQGLPAKAYLDRVVVNGVVVLSLDVLEGAAELPGMTPLRPGKVISYYGYGNTTALKARIQVKRGGEGRLYTISKGVKG